MNDLIGIRLRQEPELAHADFSFVLEGNEVPDAVKIRQIHVPFGVLVLASHGKTNNLGEKEYTGMIRAKEVEICGQSQLALWLFERTMLMDPATNMVEVIDFSNDDWMSTPLFPPFYCAPADNELRPAEELDAELLFANNERFSSSNGANNSCANKMANMYALAHRHVGVKTSKKCM